MNVKKLFINFEIDYTVSGNPATFYYNLKSKSQMHKQKQILFEKQIILLLKPYISNHSVIQKTSSLINRPHESQIFVVLNLFTGI